MSSNRLASRIHRLIAELFVLSFFVSLSLPCAQLIAQNEQNDPPEYQGITKCLDCHYSPNPLRSTEFVHMNEGKVWLEKDKHALAFRQLGSSWGKRIAAKLGIKDAQAEQSCLSCHANWQSKFDQPPKSYELGVNCEACHGPSSQWELPHADITWRQIDPTTKVKLGMNDLRSPSESARICFSCHIGDREQGKFVTHEMYVAGHPPLSSIEVGSFATQMPSHWRSLQEKPLFKHRADYARINSMSDSPGEHLPATKSVVVGGVVALRESIRLFANQLEHTTTGQLEFAAFDCSACHHELRTNSWRQIRGRIASRPGRPLPTIWPGTLVDVAIRHAAHDSDNLLQQLKDESTTLQSEFLVAAATRPFGDREKVRSAANRFLPWLDELVQEIESREIRLQDGERIMQSMIKVGQSELLDYHSARMLSWALMTTTIELNAPYAILHDENQKASYEDWVRNVKRPAAERVTTIWRNSGLLTDLNLKLPTRPMATIEGDMPGRFAAARRYDAMDFRDRFLQITEKFSTLQTDGAKAFR